MAVLTAENPVDELVRDIKDLQMFSTRYRAQFLDAVGRFDEAQMAEAYGESSTTKWLVRGDINVRCPDAPTSGSFRSTTSRSGNTEEPPIWRT